MRNLPRCFIAFFLVARMCGASSADEPLVFEKHIRPIFQKHCVKCHGPDKQEGGLRLDVRASALKGGDDYQPGIKPGKSSESPLFDFISNEKADLRMPPKGPALSAAELKDVRTWIDQGAVWPEDQAVAESSALKFWSLQPVLRPPVPDIKNGERIANPIDAFIASKLHDRGLKLSARASQSALLRRLSLVMHGLPPSPEAIARFEPETTPAAWHKLVDESLQSPRYGERWAQHWLDLVRFGETHGFETNRERPNAWPYRDYVIRAFNTDLPYDQFVREQIAGDLLGADVATGFLVAGPFDLVKSPDINLTLMQRQDELADIINTTSTTFMGLTVGCARCHNHKFDPISQKDFYALQAVFAGVNHADRQLPPLPDQAQQLAALEKRITELTEQLAPFRSGAREAVTAKHNVERFTAVSAKFVRFTIKATNGAQPCLDELEIFAGSRNVALASAGAKARSSSNLPGHEIHKLEHIHDGRYGNARSWISNESGAGWVEIEFPESAPIDRIEWARDREGKYSDRVATKYTIEAAVEPGQWKTIASSEDRQPFSGDPSATAAYRFEKATLDQAERGRQWLAELESARKQKTMLSASRVVYAGTFSQPGPTHRLFRGEPQAKREVVAPDAIEVLGTLKLAPNTPERDRRQALAQWLTRLDNPLTARVLVNRLWQFQFGRGLVDTPNDFGRNGVAPTHPELLDWLASELMDNGWSIKHVQRLILQSNTWQQASAPQPQGLDVDGGTQLLWRYPPRRIEAEAMRDSILTVTGVLDLHMGGPGFDGFEVDYENVRHYFPKKKFGPEDYRRMVYMKKVRAEKESTFGAFDCPDASQVVARRSVSTTPLQALNLLNSDFMQHQAQLFAGRLRKASSESPPAQISLAFKLCFGRSPTDDERRECVAFIESHGLAQFSRAMLNSNEFLFVP